MIKKINGNNIEIHFFIAGFLLSGMGMEITPEMYEDKDSWVVLEKIK